MPTSRAYRIRSTHSTTPEVQLLEIRKYTRPVPFTTTNNTNRCSYKYITNNRAMNKTVQSIVSLTAFSVLLIVITLFCGGLGLGRLFEIYSIMEYSFLGMLMVIDMLVIYKVYKLYFSQPKAIMLLFGVECCSALMWLAFICIDQSLLDWQFTNFILEAVSLEGFTGDERGLNILAVLCGIIYPLIGIGCLFIGVGIINKLVTTKDSI